MSVIQPMLGLYIIAMHQLSLMPLLEQPCCLGSLCEVQLFPGQPGFDCCVIH